MGGKWWIVAGMEITGERIKEARERRQLTQQELADELGVSLRTVGSWERGESVPRSRMGAIRDVLRLEGPSDNRQELGRLIREELSESGRGPYDIARGWSASALRSFYFWRDGEVTPLNKSRGMLEDSLGWRRGVVTEILEAPITRTFTLSEVRDWSAMPDPGLASARGLSTDDLLIELTRRVGAMQEELEDLRAAGNVVPLREQSHYDLAASDEHVPGEDDRD
jgi:transcriptional regulator with XRE-family HTH domain